MKEFMKCSSRHFKPNLVPNPFSCGVVGRDRRFNTFPRPFQGGRNFFGQPIFRHSQFSERSQTELYPILGGHITMMGAPQDF